MQEVGLTNKPEVKYRKNYKAPSFFIETVDLLVDIKEGVTTVTSTLRINENPHHKSSDLTLDGRAQRLISIKLNGKELSEDSYQLDDESLTIFAVPDAFELQIETQIKPQENTSLMGLYQSKGNYCTQCESDGFRRITYCLDRPDVMSLFTTRIIADKTKCPVLLSNGNLIEQKDLGDNKHSACWHDPFKKPCYLFAMVAGDLGCIEDQFTTMSGRKVDLKIFADHNEIEKCQYAMVALKKAMKWDEEVYGREYDLDIFMIVAVNDFNFGAMENKGLNVFNDKYILVDPKTATDTDYALIDAVVAHEYFHNWSGNRVTLRDWFQLSLKEGLTVFRDHSFSEDIGLSAIERINQIDRLRTMQFAEDSGPMSHPVRPDSYIEMNNFYTATVYEKGSEVIRMMKTLLGPKKYRQGTDLYFDRHDGQAVTCDDFVKAMEDASEVDLTQFKLWYSQSGTPRLTIKSDYDEENKVYRLHVEQACASSSAQPDKEPYHMPILVGLLDANGHDIQETAMLSLTKSSQTFTFENISAKPVPSLLRGFSAPVNLSYGYTADELAFLMAHDSDPVARWNAGQQYMTYVVLDLINAYQNSKPLTLDKQFISTIKHLLQNNHNDKALTAKMLQLPSEVYLAELMDVIDVEAIHEAREFVKQQLAESLKEIFMEVYQDSCTAAPYAYEVAQVSVRSLKNIVLTYLISLDDADVHGLCHQQYQTADNMTDQIAALNLLATTDCAEREPVLQHFYETWQHEPLVLDKWFSAQALSYLPGCVDRMQALINHPAFNIKNPNKVRSLVGVFSRANLSQFHLADGSGYDFLSSVIAQVDAINPMVSSRLAEPFTRWRSFDKARQDKIRSSLSSLLKSENLSKDLYEIVSKSLG